MGRTRPSGLSFTEGGRAWWTGPASARTASTSAVPFLLSVSDLLAICEPAPPGERTKTVVIIVTLAAAYVAALVLALRGSNAKLRLALLYVTTFVAGAVIVAILEGSSISNELYRLFVVVGVAVGAGAGAVLAAGTGRSQMLRHIVVGSLGAGGFFAWAVGLLFISLAVTASCIG